MLKKLSKYLCHIGNTLTGMYQRPYCEVWDTELNRILDDLQFAKYTVFHGICSLYLDDTAVWVNNKFYAYGYKNSDIVNLSSYIFNHTNLSGQKRPRFKTMLRLESLVDYLENETVNGEWYREGKSYG